MNKHQIKDLQGKVTDLELCMMNKHQIRGVIVVGHEHWYTLSLKTEYHSCIKDVSLFCKICLQVA